MMEIKFNWKAVVSGIILTVILGPILRLLIPSWMGVLSILLASVGCGYIADKDYLNGAMNGVIMGASIGILNILMVYIKTGIMNVAILSILIYALAGDMSLGFIGGSAGSLLRSLRD
ncbi:hypothetical protein DNK57_03590 [Methanothermobacter thermautotrophicus]|uniref:DUF5518 domain-containing protein n=2 Tax=Methanothermobacter thermautotrophicus TaxID=145262 RepID=A0A842YPN3_METTF|nr:hypothetical protein [Methanothermobacter thermautotrophicus]